MKPVAIVLCVLMTIASACGQISVTNQSMVQIDRSVFGLGLSAGLVSGFGVSFRHHMPGEFSYQLVGGIVKVDRKMDYDVGGELQYDFVRGEVTRFFGCGALGYFFVGESGNNELDAPFRSGVGVGGEWRYAESFDFGAELLFTYFTDGTILPLPQVGAHYYFL